MAGCPLWFEAYLFAETDIEHLGIEHRAYWGQSLMALPQEVDCVEREAERVRLREAL
jgi:hypothetical protein